MSAQCCAVELTGCSVVQRVQWSSQGAVELEGCSIAQKKDVLKLSRVQHSSIGYSSVYGTSGVCNIAQGCSVAKWSPAYSIVFLTSQIRDILSS